MSKLVENIVKSVYKIIFNVEDYESHNITPKVTITPTTFEITTPVEESFPDIYRRDLLSYSARSLYFVMLELKEEFSNRVLLGEKGYYQIPDLNENNYRIVYSRVVESNSDSYQIIRIPFLKLKGYSSYLDDLPVELLYIILLKSRLHYKQSRDVFSRVFDSSYFTWKKLFADTFPRAYQDVVNNPILNSAISNQSEWKKLYEVGIDEKNSNFGVGISTRDDSDIVLTWGTVLKPTGIKSYKTVIVEGHTYVL